MKVNLSVILFLNELELICLHTFIAIVSTQFSGFNYFCQILTILFNINHFFAHSEVVTTGWNDKIVVLKKTTLQVYFKTVIEKILSGNLIM